VIVAIGMAVVWAGYYVGLYGYCMVQGYDVTFGSLMGTSWTAAPQSPGGSGQAAPVPDPGTGTYLA